MLEVQYQTLDKEEAKYYKSLGFKYKKFEKIYIFEDSIELEECRKQYANLRKLT